MTTRTPAPVNVPVVPTTSGPLDRAPAPVSPAVDPELPRTPVPVLRPSTVAPTPAPTPYRSDATPAVVLPVQEEPVELTPAPEAENRNIIPADTPRYVTVLEDGTVVVNQAAQLNFSGSGVSVIAQGSTANIVITGGGGGGSPGGSNTQIQFNDAGSFGGDDDLTYNKNTNTLALNGTITALDAIVYGAVSAVTLGASGNITGANIIASGVVSATGNITGNYFIGNGSQLTGIVASAGSSLVNSGNAFALQSDGNVVFEGAEPGQGVNRGMVWDYGVGVGGVNSEVRQDVAGITVRAWTESGEGSYSAPVNIVTNQDSNQKTWRFDGDGNLTLPGNVNSTSISDSFSSAISNITTGESTVIVTLASEVFSEGPSEGEVIMSDVTGTTEANGVWGYQAVNIDQFELYTDATLTTPVDGTTWTAYISGGTAVAVESYVDLSIQGGNVAIGSNDKTWTFDITGNVTVPGNIVGTGTIIIDNSATGNSADIRLLSADDIVLQGKDKPMGASSEGGDINLFCGDGSPDDGIDGAGTGGDIQLFAGDGGLANIEQGGRGGLVRLYGGVGGGASVEADAGDGGYIEIFAGDAGDNNGNAERGNSGGYIEITAGDSTGNLNPGGDVIITSGQGGPNASAGQIELNVPGSDLGPGGTWSFNYQGNMIFPSNGQIVMDNGDGTIGNQGDDFVISWTNEDVVIKSVNDDVRLEADDDVQIRAGYDAGLDTYLSQWEFSNSGQLTSIPIVDGNAFNDGHIQFVGNSSGDGLGYTTLRLVPDATLTGSDQYLIVDPTAPGHIHIRAGGTQDNSSADLILGGENSFVKIAAGANNYVYVRSNSNDWTFGTDGVLTLPGEGVLQSIDDTVVLSSLNTSTGNANSVYLGSGGGLGFSDQEIGGNWLEIFRNGAEPQITVPVGRGNLNIQTAEGEAAYNWTFDNTGALNLPGEGYANSSSYIKGNYGVTIRPTNNVGGTGPELYVSYNDGIVLEPLTNDYFVSGTESAPLYISGSNFNSSGKTVGPVVLQGGQNSFNNTYGNVEVRISGNTWTFDNTGNLTIPGTSGGLIKTVANASIGIAAMDNGTDNPAQMMSWNVNQANPNTIISAYANYAAITTDVNGTPKTWQFDNAGNLTVPSHIVVSGGIVGSGASPAPSLSGFSSVSAINISATGNITARQNITAPVPLANLTAVAGARAFVNNANLVASGNFGAQISGGGSNTVPVWSDGTNWYIG